MKWNVVAMALLLDTAVTASLLLAAKFAGYSIDISSHCYHNHSYHRDHVQGVSAPSVFIQMFRRLLPAATAGWMLAAAGCWLLLAAAAAGLHKPGWAALLGCRHGAKQRSLAWRGQQQQQRTPVLPVPACNAS